MHQYSKFDQTRMMFIKHYAPQQILCIKVAKSQCAIDHWVEDCRDVTTTKLQCYVYKEKSGEGGMCTKNGSYCEQEKKSGGGGVRVNVNGKVKLL